MLKTFISIFIAYLIAPLFASVGYGIAFWIRHPNLFANLIADKGLMEMFAPNIYVTAVAYAVTLVFGLPAYGLLRWLRWDRPWVVILAGALLGLAWSFFVTGRTGWDWEYGLFPAICVASVAVLVIALCDRWLENNLHRAKPSQSVIE